jgi:hypothetical protein
MQNEINDRFPKIDLEAKQLPTGEWIIAGLINPLTEDEAKKVISAYQTIQELIGRGMSPD